MKLGTLFFLTFGLYLIVNENLCTAASIIGESYDADNGNSEKIPARARKTGGGRRNRVEQESASTFVTTEVRCYLYNISKKSANNNYGNFRPTPLHLWILKYWI